MAYSLQANTFAVKKYRRGVLVHRKNEPNSPYRFTARRGISNTALENLVFEAQVPHFLGVYSSDRLSDEIPSHLARFSVIFNMSETGHSGTHFVAIIVTEGHIIYNDSTGMPPVQQRVFTALRRWKYARFPNRQIHYTYWRIQAANSYL